MRFSTLCGLEGSGYFFSWQLVWCTTPIYNNECLDYDFISAFSFFASVLKLNWVLIYCPLLLAAGDARDFLESDRETLFFTLWPQFLSTGDCQDLSICSFEIMSANTKTWWGFCLKGSFLNTCHSPFRELLYPQLAKAEILLSLCSQWCWDVTGQLCSMTWDHRYCPVCTVVTIHGYIFPYLTLYCSSVWNVLLHVRGGKFPFSIKRTTKTENF